MFIFPILKFLPQLCSYFLLHFNLSFTIALFNDSLLSSDRSFSEDLFDNNRETRKALKTSLFRPSLFHVVKFPNDECLDQSNQSGTCYTPIQCKAYGGTGTATCANGYGQCCIISRSCHNTTAQKVVYFKNPSYPQMDSQQNFCDLTLEIRDSDVCQIRIDFLDFQMDQPINGNCVGDRLKISASGLTPTTVPTLCGTNRNQHMFVHLPFNHKDRSVSLLFETNNNGPYRWHMRLTQIDCARNNYGTITNNLNKKFVNDRSKRDLKNMFDINLGGKIRDKRYIFLTDASLKITTPAPPGCLQYYTTKSGILESFNFGHYFNSLDYSICIERLSNVCKISFSANELDFGIESNRIMEPGVGDTQCDGDYFMIPGGSQTGDDPTKDRYCGNKLIPGELIVSNQPYTSIQPVVTKANGPIVLKFHSDNQINTNLKLGFRIRFDQNSDNCQTNTILPLNLNLAYSSNGPSSRMQNMEVQNLVFKNEQYFQKSQRSNNKVLHFFK